MTMVEKIARALCAAKGIDPDAVPSIMVDWRDDFSLPSADVARPAWRGYVEAARAALEAMREPTQPMVRNGADPYAGVTEIAARAVWADMMYAALNEKDDPQQELVDQAQELDMGY